MDFDLDGAVQGEVRGLLDRMRAKRLSAELPQPVDIAPPDEQPPADESGELAALESMLDPG